jgi:hypothetical protein
MKGDADSANVMFGAITPDINQLLSADQVSPYFFATHYPAMPGLTEQGFPDLWATANDEVFGTPIARSLALGFVTHNEAWGTDYYAHIKSHLYPRYTNPQYRDQNGYVWVKAGQLCPLMKAQLSMAGIHDRLLDRLLKDTMNCHFIVEYGMDLVLKGTRDPLIGSKLLSAVQDHDATTMQALFAGTYTQEMTSPAEAPMGVIMAGTEPMWALVMTQYGNALSLPMNQAVPAVAVFLESLAEAQLFDEPLPPETKQMLTTVIELGLVDSMGLSAFDLNPELDLTVYSVRSNLASHGITY